LTNSGRGSAIGPIDAPNCDRINNFSNSSQWLSVLAS
jgi:hypothetical protein